MARRVVIGGLWALWVTGMAMALPEATVAPCATPPKIDGELDDECWKAAATFSDFHVLGQTHAAKRPTVVKASFDSKWLYLGIASHHEKPQEIQATVLNHDGPVHQDESVEVFADAGTGGEVYFHFLLNAANTQAEQRIRAGASDRGWNPAWRSAVKVHSSGWNAEIAVPLYLLAAEGDLGRLRLNIARNSGAELSTWSPVKSFHDPANFGALRGLDAVKTEIPFLAFGNVRTSGFYRADDKAQYDVTCDAGGDPEKPRKVKFVVTDQPVTGAGKSVTREMTLEKAAQTSLTLAVPVEARVRRSAVLAMEDVETGKTVQSVTIRNAACAIVVVAYLDRSYYTTEGEARVVCTAEGPQTEYEDKALVVRNGQGNVLARCERLEAETQVALRIEALRPGAHPVTVELCQKNGDPIFTQPLVLTKRPPKPGCEWKVDRINRVLLRDGKPFFPFGLILWMWRAEEIRSDVHFRHAAQMGFNTVLQWYDRMTPEQADEYQAMAAKHGLLVLGWAAAYFAGIELENAEELLGGPALNRAREVFRTSANGIKANLMLDPLLRGLAPETKVRLFDQYYQKNLPRVTDALNRLKEHPNLIGYKMFDEPPAKSYFAMYVHGRKLHSHIHETDGYHPVFLLYSSYIPEGEEYTDWADCLGTDPYWVPGNRRRELRGTVNFVSKITALTDARARQRRQVTWIVPLAEFWVAGSKRALLPQEQFCQTYLALIHGAKALIYFRHPLCGRTAVDTFAKLSRQMGVLGPIALTPEIPQDITYSTGAFDPRKNDPDQFPHVQVALRRNPAGGYVLLAANTRPFPVEVACRIPLLGSAGAVRRLFSAETHPIRDGAFSDRLEPMATRAYAFDSREPITGPVPIRVDMLPHPELATPEDAVPVAGRVGKKNLMPNPSFEESTLPGWPDYYICSTPGLGTIYYLGDPDALFSLDPTNPFHGKHAVKMVSTHPGGTWVMAEVNPKEDKPTEYVLSAYLRAERDGFEASFFGFGSGYAGKVKLTTEWKRYHVKGVVPVKSADNPLWGVRTDMVGTFWADAIQLERGSEPTDFEP